MPAETLGGGVATAPAAAAGVPREIRAQATRCWADFACLSGGPHPLCEVKHWLSDRYVFLKCQSRANCPYCIPFGLVSSVCACPVRNRIYRESGK